MTLKFNGNTRLDGSVSPSGSVYSSISLLAGCLLFKESQLSNIPNVSKINDFLNRLAKCGVESSWSARNSLHVKAAVINDGEIFDPSLIAPLLIRLGEVTIKKSLLLPELTQLFNNLEVGADLEGDAVVLRLPKIASATINLESNLASSIAALLICSVTTGEVVLNNFLVTEETLDLISFLKEGGLKVLEDPKQYGQIKIIAADTAPSTNSYSLSASSLETAFWASASVMSCGDITINNVSRERLISFLSKLTAFGVHFEFGERRLRVWHDDSHLLIPLNLEVTKGAPIYDFLPLLVPLMLKAIGESRISGVKITDEPYIKDLNLFDAKIFGDSITGPTMLKGTKVALPDFTGGLVLILAALGASGKSELLEAEKVCDFFDNLPQKLEQLSGRI